MSIVYTPSRYNSWLAHASRGIPNYQTKTNKQYTPRKDHKYLYIDENGNYIYDYNQPVGRALGNKSVKPVTSTKNVRAALSQRNGRAANSSEADSQKAYDTVKSRLASNAAEAKNKIQNKLDTSKSASGKAQPAAPAMATTYNPGESQGNDESNFFTRAADWFRGAWDTIKNTAVGAWNTASGAFNRAKEWVTGALSTVGGWAKTAYDTAAGWARTAFTGVADTGTGFWNGLTGNYQYGPDNSEQYYNGQGAGAAVRNFVPNTLGAIETGANQLANDVRRSPAVQWAQGAAEDVGDTATGFYNGLTGNYQYGPDNSEQYYNGQGAGAAVRNFVPNTLGAIETGANQLANDVRRSPAVQWAQGAAEDVGNWFGGIPGAVQNAYDTYVTNPRRTQELSTFRSTPAYGFASSHGVPQNVIVGLENDVMSGRKTAQEATEELRSMYRQ